MSPVTFSVVLRCRTGRRGERELSTASELLIEARTKRDQAQQLARIARTISLTVDRELLNRQAARLEEAALKLEKKAARLEANDAPPRARVKVRPGHELSRAREKCPQLHRYF